MNTLPMIVYASSFIRELSESTGATPRKQEERWDPAPPHGLRDVARVATAIGAIAAYAAILMLGTR